MHLPILVSAFITATSPMLIYVIQEPLAFRFCTILTRIIHLFSHYPSSSHILILILLLCRTLEVVSFIAQCIVLFHYYQYKLIPMQISLYFSISGTFFLILFLPYCLHLLFSKIQLCHSILANPSLYLTV